MLTRQCPAFPAKSDLQLVQGSSSGKTGKTVCTYETSDGQTTGVPCTYNNKNGKLIKGLGVSFNFCPTQAAVVTRDNTPEADLACYSIVRSLSVR